MDILKLNKQIFLLLLMCFILSNYGCKDKKNEMKENSLSCFNDTIIKFKNDLLIFNIVDEKINLKQCEIKFKKDKIENFFEFKINTENNSLSIIPPVNLSPRDTIIVKINNNKKYIITDFHNSPDYGGNKFIGCVLKQCKVNNKTKTLNSSIYLDLD